MNEFALDPIASPLPASAIEGLFTWRGAGIVLIGSRDEGRWVLARGWLEGDRLAHVRRWSFTQPVLFSRQVRRLVTEARGEAGDAGEEALRALAWAESTSV